MKSRKQIWKGIVPVALAAAMAASMMGTAFADEVEDVFADSSLEQLEALMDRDTVVLGSSGGTVFYVQALLNMLGNTTATDGYFGPYMESQVKAFQKDHGLAADGVAGPYTIKAMEAALTGGAVAPAPTPAPAPAPAQEQPQPAAATPSSLNVGSSGEQVKQMQQALRNLGYNVSVDGVYGTYTANVVRQFQRDNGLIVDGYAGSQTLAKLFSGNAASTAPAQAQPQTQPQAQPAASTTSHPSSLNIGARGEDVKKMQQALRSKGYNIDADGVYGNYTANVVRQFQRDNGLIVDGYAGSQTMAKLFSGNAAAPAATPAPAPAPASTSSTPQLSTSSYLKLGARNDQVKALQQKLKDLGYFNSTVDGYYGSVTEQAVRLFQTDKGLIVDGEAGQQTITRLLATSEPYNPNSAASEVEQLAKKKLDQVGWDLKAAFNWCASLQHTSWDAGNNVVSGARSAFYNNVGDCIGKACAFTVMARLLGFTCVPKWGAVLQVDGSYAAHCWCEVQINGQWYVCDPNFQWGTGRNGYLIHYGDAGTWKYRIDGNFPE